MWGTLLPFLAILGGSYISSQANTAAAERASEATLQGAQITAGAMKDVSEAAATRAAPGVSYLRRVVAEPGELTPLQRQQLEDSRRSTANTIHSSNFAGSGRTGVELLRRNESDFVNQALENNRQRAMTAAGELAGSQNTSDAAAIGAGKAVGDATAKGGLYDAQAGLASGQITGKAIGDIGSLIASQQRESRYADRVSKLEKALGING